MFYEEKQINGITFFRTSPHGDWQPKKMNYTKEMQQANITPEVGMKFICNDDTELSRIKDFKGCEVVVIGLCNDVDEYVVITFSHPAIGIGCGIFNPCWVEPIDTRTDTEKAIDDLSKYTQNNPDSTVLVHHNVFYAIKAGKIHGVKWFGND